MKKKYLHTNLIHGGQCRAWIAFLLLHPLSKGSTRLFPIPATGMCVRQNRYLCWWESGPLQHGDGKLPKGKFCRCVADRRCSCAAQDLHPNGNIPKETPPSPRSLPVAHGSLCSSKEQSTTNTIGNQICLLGSPPWIGKGTPGKAAKPGPFVYHLRSRTVHLHD